MSTTSITSNEKRAAPVIERQGIVVRFGQQYGIDPGKMLATLKATAFKAPANEPDATDAELMALLVVAEQYKLNPFTRELYAFFDKRRGIVPVVSVDGWARIVNEHPQYDGIEFSYESDAGTITSVECRIFRKDRSHPTAVREFFSECGRDTGPWKSHPSRMLRHKAFIQCARLAFGFAGIYDEDEAERIVESGAVDHDPQPRSATARIKTALITNATPTTENVPSNHPDAKKEKGTAELKQKFLESFKKCEDTEVLSIKRDELTFYQWDMDDIAELDMAYDARLAQLEG